MLGTLKVTTNQTNAMNRNQFRNETIKRQRAETKLERDTREVHFSYRAKLRFLACIHAQVEPKREALIRATDMRDGTRSLALYGQAKKASNPWAGFDASDAGDARPLGNVETIAAYVPAPVPSEVETDGELAFASGE